MRSIWGTILVFAAMGGGAAQAADPAGSYRPLPVRERVEIYPTMPIGLIPGCEEVNTRLLRCRPRMNVSPNDPGVTQVIDAPPVLVRPPYPEFFSW